MEDLEKFLSDFFCLLSTFCYDKAKEMVERERVMSRPGFIRAFFIQLLNLCEAEKTYYNLGFLSTKTKIFVNLRKDSSLRAMYDSLRQELHKLEGVPSGSNDPIAQAFETTIAPLANQLCHFSTARQQLIDVYEKIYNMGIGTKHIKYDELRGQVEAIIEMHVLPHPLLSSVRNCISWECESLMHCLGAQTKLGEWTMLPSLIHLHAAHTRLTLWEKSIQVKESWKIGFLKSPNQPLLYMWLWRYRSHLVNKVALYFYSTLSQQTSAQEMRNYLSPKNTDLYFKLQSLQKKCLAGYIALVFDPRGLAGWRGPGYSHPGRASEPPLDQYVLMLSQPTKIGAERMQGISRALDGRTPDLITPDKPSFYFNPEVHHSTRLDKAISCGGYYSSEVRFFIAQSLLQSCDSFSCLNIE